MNEKFKRKHFIQICIPLFVLCLSGCLNDVYSLKLSEIEHLDIQPEQSNHAVIISINGYVDCPVTLYVLGDGERHSSPVFHLSGEVDTTERFDWYADPLSFELEKKADCSVDEDVRVTVEMLDSEFAWK